MIRGVLNDDHEPMVVVEISNGDGAFSFDRGVLGHRL